MTNTLIISGRPLTEAALEALSLHLGKPTQHTTGHCATFAHSGLVDSQIQSLSEQHRLDRAHMPTSARLSDYGLLAMDMDSTLINIECVDEIADYCGKKAEVAAITEAAMRGEITDYNESLRRRVALLAGLPESVLQQVYDERLKLHPGAEKLLTAARQAGLKTLLVSGGFTFFTDRLKTRLGLDFTRSNTLEIIDGKLTGHLQGEIVNAHVKRATVQATCDALGMATRRAIVMGDGANDLEMMRIAGMSIAYHAKPTVAAQASHAIMFGGLDVVLDWFEDCRTSLSE
jgi:phosphoserine phosphatase